MKKLMIALAAVVCATAVQAAAFIWKSGNYSTFRNADGSAITTAAGYSSALNGGSIVLVLLESGTYDGAKSVLTGSTGNTAEFKTSGTNAAKYGLNTTFGFTYDETAENNVLKNGDVVGVMYRDSSGALSQLFYVDADGNKGADIATTYTISGLTDNSWQGTTWNFTPAATASTATYFAAAPEPTSGLLLLLGMAGLALKRKRA